jgi:serine/threonine protein phosphatase PrpC
MLLNPQRNILLAAVGSDEEYHPAVSEKPMLIRAGDVFLLCSDGLWEYVDESMMLRLLAVSSTLPEWLVKMETELLQRASKEYDNYSALAVRLSEACSGNP